MKIIGITGGIGVGKTYVANRLKELGYPVYSSDIRAKHLMTEYTEIRLKIQSIFGKEAYVGHDLNRKYLAQRIFHDISLRDKLNAIVHPVVHSDFERWKEEQNSRLIFNEAAILFETGRYKNFDATILVIAPMEVRVQRVMQRDNCSKEDVESRMNNQWPEEKKRKLADFIIENDGNKSITPQIEAILKLICI